jgi:pyruvate formate-lyase activating enzyme-like uncharacterized protein
MAWKYLMGEMPKGCRICMRGGKLTLFVTGLCVNRCFYCPVSMDKRYDVCYANERIVKAIDDIVEEARLMNAEGTGITGGEPLLVFDRVKTYINLLKDTFGSSHHIHLYTTELSSRVVELVDRGLDEVRYHPVNLNMGEIDKSIVKRVGGIADIGIEIPSIPGRYSDMAKLVLAARDLGFQFININELEFSEANYKQLRLMGLRIRRGHIAAVNGSMDEALKIVRWASGEVKDISIHICPSSFKDKYQYRLRLIKTAKNIAKPYEKINNDGTITKLVVETKNPKQIVKKTKIPRNMYEISRNKFETSVRYIDRLVEIKNVKMYRYTYLPTYDRKVLIVDEIT